MQIRIQLPNPDDYRHSMERWFAQMSVSLKAAEKTYKEALVDLTEEEKKDDDCTPWIRFRLVENEHDKLDGLLDESLQENLFLEVASL